MLPIMWGFSGFKFELPQESHKWHLQKFNPNNVPDNVAVKVTGDDNSSVDNRSHRIHIPILGGWKNYVILKAEKYKEYWLVGWKVKFNNNRPDYCDIQKLKIHSPYIKVLKVSRTVKSYSLV